VHRESADDGPVNGGDGLLHVVGLNALLRRRFGSLHLCTKAMRRGETQHQGKHKRAGAGGSKEVRGRKEVCGILTLEDGVMVSIQADVDVEMATEACAALLAPWGKAWRRQTAAQTQPTNTYHPAADTRTETHFFTVYVDKGTMTAPMTCPCA